MMPQIYQLSDCHHLGGGMGGCRGCCRGGCAAFLLSPIGFSKALRLLIGVFRGRFDGQAEDVLSVTNDMHASQPYNDRMCRSMIYDHRPLGHKLSSYHTHTIKGSPSLLLVLVACVASILHDHSSELYSTQGCTEMNPQMLTCPPLYTNDGRP